MGTQIECMWLWLTLHVCCMHADATLFCFCFLLFFFFFFIDLPNFALKNENYWKDICCLHCRTRHFVTVLEMCKIMSYWKAYIFLTTKHNSGLLLAIGPDLSTLVFQTNQDNYDEQVLGWNSFENKPFLTERIWHVLAMSLVLGFTLKAGRGVSWTSWVLTCANSCTGELEVPSSFILEGEGGSAREGWRTRVSPFRWSSVSPVRPHHSIFV